MSDRHTAAVTTLSWIPTEAIEEAPLLKAPFSMHLLHYDTPPPDHLPDLSVDHLADDVTFRFAHRLAVSIEVKDGQIISAQYDSDSRGAMGGTTVGIGTIAARLRGVPLPVLREEPEISATSATFQQTFGGRTGLPAPRLVADRPHIRWQAPLVWTTLRVTLHADGRVDVAMPGASRFPRHWIYGPDGELTGKSALTTFNAWYRRAHGEHTPWGDEDAPALVADVETEIERSLSTAVMQGGVRPAVRSIAPGTLLTEQGGPAGPVFVILDGILAVEIDGEQVAQVGPGAVVGERAHLEDGTLTSTLRALTQVRFAEAAFGDLDALTLQRLSLDHHREDT